MATRPIPYHAKRGRPIWRNRCALRNAVERWGTRLSPQKAMPAGKGAPFPTEIPFYGTLMILTVAFLLFDNL